MHVHTQAKASGQELKRIIQEANLDNCFRCSGGRCVIKMEIVAGSLMGASRLLVFTVVAHHYLLAHRIIIAARELQTLRLVTTVHNSVWVYEIATFSVFHNVFDFVHFVAYVQPVMAPQQMGMTLLLKDTYLLG